MFVWPIGAVRLIRGDAIVASSVASRNACLLAWSKRYVHENKIREPAKLVYLTFEIHFRS